MLGPPPPVIVLFPYNNSGGEIPQIRGNHRGPSVCVTDCYLITNVLDLLFAKFVCRYVPALYVNQS